MVWQLQSRLRLWISHVKSNITQKGPTESSTDQNHIQITTDSDRLPLQPRELLAGRLIYEIPLLQRKPADPDTDTPIASLYRIYEHLVLDQHIAIRNEFEAFWFQSSWALCKIPDPRDPNPERYACLAGIVRLLCLAFNKRIDLGLPRDAPSIFTQSMLKEWRASERLREETPIWVAEVPKLDEILQIPHWDNTQREFVPLDSFTDDRASQEFADKNILLWQPHIHFI